MSSVIVFENVKKSYGKKDALKGLSFSVQTGELLALLGPNGAGKSTALSLIMGQRTPDSGKIQIFGKRPSHFSVKQKLGVTLQDLSFPPLMKVQELLQFSSQHFQNPLPMDEVVIKIGLQNIFDRKAGGLSGGEKRKLGLAMSLMGRPELLILDEPTTGMDVEARRDLWKVIESLVKEGRTIVLTTHYLEEVEALASRVVVVDHGESLFDGTVQQIKSIVEIKKIQFYLSENDGLPVLHKLQGLLRIETKRNQVQLWTHDSDFLITELVKNNVQFKDLSVEIASLEEAFLEIRGLK